jgi:periplasmic divalent cation tolerance protein
MSDEWMMAYVTTENAEQAESLGRTLVLEKLAGCVNILPAMKSLYLWNGQLETSHESVLLVKTHRTRQKEVENRILELHPYQTPCILFLPIQDGNAAYFKWLGNGCGLFEPNG